ncbi:large ribosomal subunit protein bL31m [Diutina catenulata]
MFSGIHTTARATPRLARGIAMKGEIKLSNRRVMRKIEMGRARPTTYYQFDTLVELSDGSVIKRRSQAPKDEIRMISDQRNSNLWNPNRSDLVTSDPNATGKVSKFQQKYAQFGVETPTNNTGKKPAKEERIADDFVELMGHNVQEVQAGGKIYDKKKDKGR